MFFVDCTLRDGGYYTNWDFDVDTVNAYLSAMHSAKIDLVEIGFRFFEKKGYRGAFAYSKDSFIESLSIPNGLLLGVMINAADLYRRDDIEEVLVELFPRPASESPVHVVRIACHFEELSRAYEAAGWLHSRGYRVGLNLMQVVARSASEIEQFAKHAAGTPVEVLYVADSTGSLRRDKVREIFSRLRKNWSGPLGMHAHDNLGLALENTIAANDAGAVWLDSTVTGMGRGPGNAKTEELLLALNEDYCDPASMSPLLAIVRKTFQPLKEDCGWGTNAYYFIAGKHQIHPSYVQALLEDERYDDHELLTILEYLGRQDSLKYSNEIINSAVEYNGENLCGSWMPIEEISGRDVLLVGGGNSLKGILEVLQVFIAEAKPVVILLNSQNSLPAEVVDFRAALNPIRFIADIDFYKTDSAELIAPSDLIDLIKDPSVLEARHRSYGCTVEEGRFEFQDSGAVIPNSLTLSYALAACGSARCKRIYFVGFDGYERGDKRNQEVDQTLKGFLAVSPETELISLTATKYQSLGEASIHAFV